MVIASVVASVRTQKTAFAGSERDAEVIGRRIDRPSHVGDAPAARARHLGTEDVEAAVARMAVRGEIHHRVGAHIREHLVAGSVDPFAEVLERACAFAQVDAPDVFAARAAGHVGCEIEPVAVGRHSRMAVARECVGRDLELNGRAPLGIASLRGVDFDARVGVGLAAGAGEIHGRAVGRERYDAFLGLGVELAFDRFGTFPFAAFVFRCHPYIALFHAVDFAAFGAVDFFVGRGEVYAVERCVEIHRRVV